MSRRLTFSRRYIPLILGGEKTQTRRPPDQDPKLEAGDVVAVRVPWKKETYGLIEITDVRIQPLEEISQEEVEREGFKTLADFKRTWGRMYGPMNGREMVTVYEFRLISRPGIPKKVLL